MSSADNITSAPSYLLGFRFGAITRLLCLSCSYDMALSACYDERMSKASTLCNQLCNQLCNHFLG